MTQNYKFLHPIYVNENVALLICNDVETTNHILTPLLDYLRVENLKHLAVNTFAKHLGFKNGNAYGFKGLLRRLEKLKVVEVQQGGFYADSMHHNKLVIVKDLDFIHRFVNPQLFPEKKPPKWHRKPRHKHKGFREVMTLKEIFSPEHIRVILLKCEQCDFSLRVTEINGKAIEARPL